MKTNRQAELQTLKDRREKLYETTDPGEHSVEILRLSERIGDIMNELNYPELQ